GYHTMGGMQMGVDPKTSVIDGDGRMHQMDNVYVADGSVFTTSTGSNPTNTIMSVALRTVRGLTGQRLSASTAQAPVPQMPVPQLPFPQLPVAP
ncbi:MAG: GMC family oxidoreductase, partial [Mycobacterium sp.]